MRENPTEEQLFMNLRVIAALAGGICVIREYSEAQRTQVVIEIHQCFQNGSPTWDELQAESAAALRVCLKHLEDQR